MLSLQNKILDHEQTLRKIRRIAFEIYEQNIDEDGILFAGIVGGGYQLAQKLQEEFSKIAHIPCELAQLQLDKQHPTRGPITISAPVSEISGKVVVLVDDVLNTGRTIAYCLPVLLQTGIKKMQLAVLIDRDHRQFPVSANFIGYSLSTTVNQHIEVVYDDKEEYAVYLY